MLICRPANHNKPKIIQILPYVYSIISDLMSWPWNKKCRFFVFFWNSYIAHTHTHKPADTHTNTHTLTNTHTHFNIHTIDPRLMKTFEYETRFEEISVPFNEKLGIVNVNRNLPPDGDPLRIQLVASYEHFIVLLSCGFWM